MTQRNYSVYHFDTLTRETKDAIVRDVSLSVADKKAAEQCRMRTRDNDKSWKRVQAGENCRFQIEGERMGFMVTKNNTGTDYETARKSQTKALGQ